MEMEQPTVETGNDMQTVMIYDEINRKKGTADKECYALFVSVKAEKLTVKERKAFFADHDVVMIGYAGLAGSVILAEHEKEKLAERYPEVFIKNAIAQRTLLQKVPEAATAVMSDECAVYHLGKAGVFDGLWKMAQIAGVGLEIECKQIPVKQETVEICNFFDINPYELFSTGASLVLAPNGYRLIHELQKMEIPAAIIGVTTNGNDRVVVNGEEKRFLEKRYQDALLQIHLEYISEADKVW